MDTKGTGDNAEIFKKAWVPITAVSVGMLEVPTSWLTINMVVTSNVIWPGEPMHVQELSLIFTLCFLVGGIMRLFWGFLTDRFSRKNLLAINKIGTGLGFMLYGFIPSGSRTLGFSLAILFTIIRESFSGMEVMGMSYIDDAIEEEKRSNAFGIGLMVNQLCYLAACLLGAFTLRYIWHEYFFIIGIFGMAIGIIIFVKGKEPKRASERKELKSLLKLDGNVYDFKLTKETIKKALFSKTNFIVLVEGIFTQLMLIIPLLLFYAYIESPPYHASPEVAALIIIIFGAPGSIIGSIVFAKASDKVAKKKIKNRIYIIISALSCLYLTCAAIFFVPLSSMTTAQGSDFFYFLSFPTHWLLLILMFAGHTMVGLFNINQKPLIQKLNLPEAQGLISSANAFLEIISIAIAGFVSMAILTTFNYNYQATGVVLMCMAFIGASMWLVALKTVDPDMEMISSILGERAEKFKKE